MQLYDSAIVEIIWCMGKITDTKSQQYMKIFEYGA